MAVTTTCNIVYNDYNIARMNFDCGTPTTLYESMIPSDVALIQVTNDAGSDCTVTLTVMRENGTTLTFNLSPGQSIAVLTCNLKSITATSTAPGKPSTFTLTGNVETAYCKCCPC